MDTMRKVNSVEPNSVRVFDVKPKDRTTVIKRDTSKNAITIDETCTIVGDIEEVHRWLLCEAEYVNHPAVLTSCTIQRFGNLDLHQRRASYSVTYTAYGRETA